MSIDFYRLVAPMNNNQWIVIDYYCLYCLQSIDQKPLIDNAGLVSISQIGLEYVVMRTQINILLSPEYSD